MAKIPFEMRAIDRAVFKIKNRRGLHARAAAKFVHLCEQFDCSVTVTCGNKKAPGRSIMGLLMLGAAMGSEISVDIVGEGGDELLAHLRRLIDDCFDEEK